MEVKRSVGVLETVDHSYLGQLFVQSIYALKTHEIKSLYACLTDGITSHFFKVALTKDETLARLLDVTWVTTANQGAGYWTNFILLGC